MKLALSSWLLIVAFQSKPSANDGGLVHGEYEEADGVDHEHHVHGGGEQVPRHLLLRQPPDVVADLLADVRDVRDDQLGGGQHGAEDITDHTVLKLRDA